MDYTFLQKNLSFTKLHGNLAFTSDRLKISGAIAALWEGTVTGGLDTALTGAQPAYSASIELSEVDFASLTKTYFNNSDTQGRLSARYRFAGRGEDARSMEGRGEASVANGNLFAVPFFGPLSGILNDIVPGLGRDEVHQASATFAVAKGVITTDDLTATAQAFSMRGDGKLFFLDDKMDFDMRINTRGLTGLLLFPVSKLFEYTADKSLSKPEWHLKLVPRL